MIVQLAQTIQASLGSQLASSPTPPPASPQLKSERIQAVGGVEGASSQEDNLQPGRMGQVSCWVEEENFSALWSLDRFSASLGYWEEDSVPSFASSVDFLFLKRLEISGIVLVLLSI